MSRKPSKLSHERYLAVALRVYKDCAASCCIAPSSAAKDIETLSRRTREEGMSFLTKALPTLGKCLDKTLGSDIPFPECPSFSVSEKTGYPIFLGEFWKLIFPACGNQAQPVIEGEENLTSHDWRAQTNDVYKEVHFQVEAVRAVRQITYLFYKLEGSHSKESEQKCLQDFVQTDAALPEPDAELILPSSVKRVIENARMILFYALKGLDLSDILPKHGPGSVATGEKPWEKFNFSRFYEKLDREYSYPDYFFFNYSHLADLMENLESLSNEEYACAKIVLVDKDSRGPRIISMEPLELQWIQQGQMRALTKWIESNPYTGGCVNFTSQEVNRDLALLHSVDGDYVTIDMKEASDRVSLWLVKQLFPGNILDKLLSSRSDYTQLPDGYRMRLKKFAPMGSAVCFPVEALVFWALAVGTMVDVYRIGNMNSLPAIYVYGDDIVLPKVAYAKVTHIYEQVFLLVNRDKCCVGRFFRESCGMDAYKKVSVTPIRHRKKCDLSSPVALLAYTAYCNAHYAKGHLETAKYLRGRIIGESGQLPWANVEGTIPLSFVDPGLTNEEVLSRLRSHFKMRYNRALQREEVKVKVTFTPKINRGEPDWCEIMRKGSLGSFQDPFGFDERKFSPCDYDLAKATRLRWEWVDVSRLAGK